MNKDVSAAQGPAKKTMQICRPSFFLLRMEGGVFVGSAIVVQKLAEAEYGSPKREAERKETGAGPSTEERSERGNVLTSVLI